jgi:hypothetical protein
VSINILCAVSLWLQKEDTTGLPYNTRKFWPYRLKADIFLMNVGENIKQVNSLGAWGSSLGHLHTHELILHLGASKHCSVENTYSQKHCMTFILFICGFVARLCSPGLSYVQNDMYVMVLLSLAGSSFNVSRLVHSCGDQNLTSQDLSVHCLYIWGFAQNRFIHPVDKSTIHSPGCFVYTITPRLHFKCHRPQGRGLSGPIGENAALLVGLASSWGTDHAARAPFARVRKKSKETAALRPVRNGQSQVSGSPCMWGCYLGFVG